MYPKVVDSGNKTGNVNLTLNYKKKNRQLCMASPEQYNYTTDLFQSQALKWLEGAAKDADVTPFFLYLSFTVPHAGGWSDTNLESGAPVPTDGRYQTQTSWPIVERDHAGVITYLDTYVGQVMSLMETLDIEENTLLFFASDNGAHLEGGHSYTFFNSTGGLRGHKRSMYEGGVRSPTVVKWKGTIPEGSVSDYPWSFWDVMPTLAEIAGVAQEHLPAEIDGHSILPTLRGGVQAPPSYMYYTGSSAWGGRRQDESMNSSSATTNKTPAAETTSYSIRVGNMKAVVSNCMDKPTMSDTMQLFNLTSDPFETTDISQTSQSQVEKIKQFIIGENVSCACYQC
jgi:arylsulfatase A-like enzyme